MLTLTTDGKEAKIQLREEIADPTTVKMLIFGNGATQMAIVQKAETRAATLPMRKVIWVQNPQILSREETDRYRQSLEEIVVCTLDVEGRPVSYLQEQEADSFLNLEHAFIAAQKESGV